eukprot:CAMPEP_0183797374 /NCGR_PEP_ID=MMETSP0803_2-20130417/15501_1 /TAXON_ID=195967 /ORGANISM="Crustomastix stigmata, Strain CCMP3273" /LENGTH=63 /DNA_ID=CAMNT_0026042041 /DNA_START=41 /DNA_END=228 /DNA_ORIENTATION=-
MSTEVTLNLESIRRVTSQSFANCAPSISSVTLPAFIVNPRNAACKSASFWYFFGIATPGGGPP